MEAWRLVQEAWYRPPHKLSQELLCNTTSGPATEGACQNIKLIDDLPKHSECYIDRVQKQNNNNNVVPKIRAV